MAEQTFTESDRTDGIEPDMVDANNAPKSSAPETPAVAPMPPRCNACSIRMR